MAEKPKRPKKRRLRYPAVIFITAFALACAYAAYALLLPSYKIVPFAEYHAGPGADGIAVVLEDEPLGAEYSARVIGGELPGAEYKSHIADGGLYFPFCFVKDHIDEYIFWDGGANRLSVTTPSEVLYITAGDTEYFKNFRPAHMERAVVDIGGTAYIPDEFLTERCGIEINYLPEHGIVTVDRAGEKTFSVVAAKKTRLRYEPDRRSPSSEILRAGAEVVTYGSQNGFIKVRAESGATGYVDERSLVYSRTERPEPRPEPRVWRPERDGRIVLAWDLVTNPDAASSPARRVADAGVNVVSPTWFEFDAESPGGEIMSLADRGFVDWAHENGIEVWALVSDGYSAAVSHAVLTETAKREHAVRQLTDLADEYGLDGINIDFEQVLCDDAPYFLQFLRELSPVLRERGVSLSVDLYVPEFTRYYNRAEITKVVDYICVMTYDEHAANSLVSGPVASLGFVEKGIAETLEEVPADMVLMGVPFYNRVWREEETDGGVSVTQKSYSMDYGREIFDSRGAEFSWLGGDTGCNYAEYESNEEGDEAVYRIWLEDERSIAEKIKLIDRYGLAGAACWRRGLESDGTWDVIARIHE